MIARPDPVTFHFWVNDDDDAGETEGSDIPGSEHPDSGNSVVDGMRDLTDFFPVQLDLRSLLEIFPAQQYRYLLKTEGENMNFAFTTFGEQEAGYYLAGDGTGIGPAKTLGAAKTFRVVKAGINLQDSEGGGAYLLRARDEGRDVILVEGRVAGNKPLVLEIQDVNGNKVFDSRLNVSLDGIEQMFRHKNLIKELAANKDNRDFYEPPYNNIPAVGVPDRLVKEEFGNWDHFSGFNAQNGPANVVYVHGPQEGREAMSEVFKRLYWSGSKAKFLGISWYGYDSQSDKFVPLCLGRRSTNYHVNVRHAYNTGILLKNFIAGRGLANTTFIAHSLGNVVLSSAIKNGLSYERYLMVNAAVAEEAFLDKGYYADEGNWKTNTRPLMYHPLWQYPNGQDAPPEDGYRPFLWSSEWYKLFSDDRSKLTWRDFFAKVRQDQRVFAFFAPTDEAFIPFNFDPWSEQSESVNSKPNYDDVPGIEDALENWSCNDTAKLGTYAWPFNELLKGRLWSIIDAGSSSYNGWGFNKDQRDGHYVCKTVGTLDGGQTEECGMIAPGEANAIRPEVLGTRPFFKKNPGKADKLYTDSAVSLKTSEVVELLANDMPALTFAMGHAGSEEAFKENRNINIRQKYLEKKNAAWPSERNRKYEWRHNDLYFTAFPYVHLLYDDFASLINNGEVMP